MSAKSNNLNSNIWLHRGSITDALDMANRIDEAPDVGYVYLLALSNGHTKVGATANFTRRIDTHRNELRRYSLAVEHCLVTRPHFNYHEIERAVLRRFIKFQFAGEVLDAPIKDLADFVESQTLILVAPADYGLSKQQKSSFLLDVMKDISEALCISPYAGLPSYVSNILNRHIKLGRETGLSEQDAMRNALAVIEAYTDLNLSALRNVLREVA